VRSASRRTDRRRRSGQEQRPYHMAVTGTGPRRAASRWGRVVWDHGGAIDRPGRKRGPDVRSSSREVTAPPEPSRTAHERCRSAPGRVLTTADRWHGVTVWRQGRTHSASSRSGPSRSRWVTIDCFTHSSQRGHRGVQAQYPMILCLAPPPWGLSLIPPLGSARASEQSVLLRSCHDETVGSGFGWWPDCRVRLLRPASVVHCEAG
jgi:hypothetical protein